MRILFMGTPAFAVPALDALHAAGHEIVAVYTRAPQPAGRGKPLRGSEVDARAQALGIPVFTPGTLRTPEALSQFAAHGPDVAVVAAYGLILPQAILDIPHSGCLNIHASLLPRWRGAAPIQRAILAGDETTGVTIMRMEAGLDTGPMLAAEATPTAGKTAGDLTTELALMGARLMLHVLETAPHATPQPQAGVTHAAKLQKAEAALDFSQSAATLERTIRAFNPVPGAFTTIAGERLKILAADVLAGTGHPGTTLDDALTIATAEGLLRPTRLQRAGRPPMDREALLRGWTIPAGTKLG